MQLAPINSEISTYFKFSVGMIEASVLTMRTVMLSFIFNSVNCGVYIHSLYYRLYYVPDVFVFYIAGEQLERAFHLSLAALLGEGVYNFGELVSYKCFAVTNVIREFLMCVFHSNVCLLIHFNSKTETEYYKFPIGNIFECIFTAILHLFIVYHVHMAMHHMTIT